MSGVYVVVAPDGNQRRLKEPKKGRQLHVLQFLAGTPVVKAYVERVRVRFEGKVRDGYVDEDGIQKRLPVNNHATRLLAKPFDPKRQTLYGNLVIWVPDPRLKVESMSAAENLDELDKVLAEANAE